VKVLVAHNRYVSTAPSGENVVVDLEIDLLRAAGVEVVPYLPSSDQLSQLSLPAKALLPVGPLYARQGVRDIAALLQRERPDVLHLHNPYPLISPAVVRTAHRYGMPVVQTVHNYRHVCVKGTYFRDEHDCRECLGKAVGYPAVRHGCYRGSRVQSVPMAASLAAHRGTWRSVDRYIALTPAIAEHLRQAAISDAITVKPNCVLDPGRHDQRGSGFAYVGRLAEEKGLPLLLEAWRRHPEGSLGQLRIAGDGPLLPLVRAAAADRSDIDVLGRVTPEARDAVMRESAVTVVPSVWDEVCPMVAVESLANARPLLASDRGGLPYLVGADGGWLVPPTADAWATALAAAAAATTPATASAVGSHQPEPATAARRRYETTFAPEVVMGQLLAVYAEVSGRPKP